MVQTKSRITIRQSRLIDSHTEVCLVSPLAVVVRPCALGLALQAHAVLLLGDAAAVVEGNSCVLLRAWVVGHFHHALLMLHNLWIRASSARILLFSSKFLLMNRSKRDLGVHVQEGSQLAIYVHLR